MNDNKLNIISVDWLDSCPMCGSSVHDVRTKSDRTTWLYTGDEVTCKCGEKGEIETDGNEAWVNWEFDA